MALNNQVADNCWICEGWTQVHFEFIPGVSNDMAPGETHDPHVPIYLHMEQDDYK